MSRVFRIVDLAWGSGARPSGTLIGPKIQARTATPLNPGLRGYLVCCEELIPPQAVGSLGTGQAHPPSDVRVTWALFFGDEHRPSRMSFLSKPAGFWVYPPLPLDTTLAGHPSISYIPNIQSRHDPEPVERPSAPKRKISV